MFRKMPFILIALILAILFLGNLLPLEIKSILYALSLSIKEGIIFLLPLIIFGLLFKVAIQLASQATRIILLIIATVCRSNFISTLISQYAGSFVYQFDLALVLPKDTQGLTPAWSFVFPKLIANNKAMLLGLIFGILTSYFYPSFGHKIATPLEKTITKILAVFIYLIPLFVAGFIVKLQFDGVIYLLAQDYAVIFAVIALAQFSYIVFLYLLANQFNLKPTLQSIKNIFPAAITGFSTMSSASAMPLTIVGAEKNAKNPVLARSVIPATVNIHLIGDCFAIPIFAFAVLKSYGMATPALLDCISFAVFFVLAKFSVAAVPGGGILVMLPILESYLGFNAEMLSLMTALYVLFDPVITSANVLGNGAFAMIIDRLHSFFGFKTYDQTTG